MIKRCLSLAWLLMLFTIATSASAQLKVVSKTYKIPKFNNTASSADNSFTLKLDSEYMSYHVLEPLSSSPYPFEVRCSYSGITTNIYVVKVLRANKDSLWWDQYTMRRTKGQAPGASKYILIGKGRGSIPEYLSVFYKHSSISVNSYSIIDSLIHSGLFTQPSREAILANLKNKGVTLKKATVMDCCTDMLFNIKANNNYRSFIYNDYDFQGNPGIKELADASKLVSMFLYIASDR